MQFEVGEFQKKRCSRFGQELLYFETVDSTNTVAERLARDGSAEGIVVLADLQIQGRGRKGREWFSPPGANLYFSLLLRPKAKSIPFLPFMSGLAVAKMLEVLSLVPDLKWPNDVLVRGRKISGVLIQTSLEENRLQFAIVGCGINVNQLEFPPELHQRATSIALEKGEKVSRESVLASYLLEFERLYQNIESRSWADFCTELEQHSSYIRGNEVQVITEDGIYEGVTAGLDSYGGLIMNLSSGEERVFYAGEIEACRKK